MNGREYSFSLSDIWSQYVAQVGLKFLILQSSPPKFRDYMRECINFCKLL